MLIGGKEFAKDKTHVMGILNVTPDSFSDGGKFNTITAALRHTEQMIKDGAEIIDVGGESTRPGYAEVSVAEEIQRTAPVIEALKKEFSIPVSIDTYKNEVANAALNSGADLLNDIWGLKHDDEIAFTAKRFDVPVCLMHNRNNTDYSDFLSDVLNDLRQSIQIAKNAGITEDKIILDPGIGFAKSYEQNLQLTNRLEILHELGYPLLLGTSRKSMIGLALDLPKEERVEGTLATSVIGCMKGVMFVRVHDVKENVRAIRMTEAILNI